MLRALVCYASVLAIAACTIPGDPWLESKDTGTPPVDTGSPSDIATPDGVSPDTVQPAVPTEIDAIMQKYCAGGGCHDGVPPLITSDPSTLLEPTPGFYPGCDSSQTAAECSLIRMKDKTMPLGSGCADPSDPAACPSEDEISAFEAWIKSLEPEGPPDYAKDIEPILDQFCGGCHAGASPAFTGNPGALDATPPGSYGCTGTVAECILEVMQSGDMPLGTGCSPPEEKDGCPTQQQIDLIAEWVALGAPH